MPNYRERPRYRNVIMQLCKEYNCNLKGLWYLEGDKFGLSPSLRKQLIKMLHEKGIEVI